MNDAAKNSRKNASVKGMASEHAYRRLREEIVRGLVPGEDLNEELLTSLGLSRTPAREALVRLAGDGLVELMPNRGARVAPLGWTEVREHLEGLDVMHRLVSRLSAVRRTDKELAIIEKDQARFEKAALQNDGVLLTEANLQFHVSIGVGAHNSVFERCYRQVLTQGIRIDRHAMFEASFQSHNAYTTHLETIMEQHAALVAAIRNREADEADAVAAQHAMLTRQRITQALTDSTPLGLNLSFTT